MFSSEEASTTILKSLWYDTHSRQSAIDRGVYTGSAREQYDMAQHLIDKIDVYHARFS